MIQRTLLTGLGLVWLAAQACSNGGGKTEVAEGGMGGMGGLAGAPGDAGGEPAVVGGMGGMDEIPAGGMGGALEVVGGAGAGGLPPLPDLPELELLFTVKDQGRRQGLPGTALYGEGGEGGEGSLPHPQNLIFTSSTGSQNPVNGTNAVRLTGVDLGLDPTDAIAAFALVQPEPANPLYLFSVNDGSKGEYLTRLYQSQADQDEEAQLFYSDGMPSPDYNLLFATEASLGLAGFEPDGPGHDDLIGLAAHDVREPLGDIYFTVNADAAGAADSAVATTAANERGCTVFRSERDGTNSVAFTCAELGLALDDQIDGLALWGDSTPSRVLFSVTDDSLGATDTAVWVLTSAAIRAAATLFESPGDGSNAVHKADVDLGLDPDQGGDLSRRDDIDGFTVLDVPARRVARAGSCNLSYSPFDAVDGGDFVEQTGVGHVGSNVLVLSGITSTGSNRLIAYNATTCAFLQQEDVPIGFEEDTRVIQTFAIVALAGWDSKKPLDKVEYLRITGTGAADTAITRYDAAGDVVASFPVSGVSVGYDLVHDPVADRLYIVSGGSVAVMPVPAPTDTVLTATHVPLNAPCSNVTSINGTDAAGNLYVAEAGDSGNEFHVCVVTPGIEIAPLPYTWSVQKSDDRAHGFIAPNGAHFVMHRVNERITIERGAYQ
jgi:hypothetical protein